MRVIRRPDVMAPGAVLRSTAARCLASGSAVRGPSRCGVLRRAVDGVVRRPPPPPRSACLRPALRAAPRDAVARHLPVQGVPARPLPRTKRLSPRALMGLQEPEGSAQHSGGNEAEAAAEGRPSLCPATVPLTPSASLNGICNDSNRPQPLWQPARLTASGAGSEVPSLLIPFLPGDALYSKGKASRALEGGASALPGRVLRAWSTPAAPAKAIKPANKHETTPRADWDMCASSSKWPKPPTPRTPDTNKEPP